MFNPIELVYIAIFYVYKFLSSKSRTLESLWYRLDGEVFNPELIRVTKHSILGLFGMTKIHNKTTDEREYVFHYLSYHSIIEMNKLYSFRTMMVYLKESGKVKQIANGIGLLSNSRPMVTMATNYKPDRYSFWFERTEIPIGDKIGILKMDIAFAWISGKLSIVGIPGDILLMLDGGSEHFKRAVDTYIKHYHSVSYNLITNR